jgi:hypothetical protein
MHERVIHEQSRKLKNGLGERVEENRFGFQVTYLQNKYTKVPMKL